MIRKILSSQDPKLRQKSKPVIKIDKKVLALIQDLKDSLDRQKDPEGVGLAAPQIGKNLRIFVIKHKGVKKVIINPDVLETKKVGGLPRAKSRGQIMEGCLSLPNYYGGIERPNFVKLKYQYPRPDTRYQIPDTKIEIFRDFLAQIVLHEIDHLNGILFIDRLLAQKKPLYKLDRGEWEEVEI